MHFIQFKPFASYGIGHSLASQFFRSDNGCIFPSTFNQNSLSANKDRVLLGQEPRYQNFLSGIE